jgi:anti-sigma regulatory factor (Ser/Thr protein kinase)
LRTNLSALIPITESSQIGEARRAATYLAERAGFDETQCGKVAIVATESARNILQHAGGVSGEIVVQIVLDGDAAHLHLYALDKGVGMTNVAECLRDGFSTAGTAGEGMGAIQRLSHEFDIYSPAGGGTAVFASIPARQNADKTFSSTGWSIGAISLPKTGEEECGDSWDFDLGPRTGRFIVADGLGHGPMAAEASREAIRVFEAKNSAAQTPVRMMETIHQALHPTRGAAVSLAIVDVEERSVRFVGVGNVAGALVSSEKVQSMMSHNGTAGAQMHKIQEMLYPLPDRGVLLLASDGISARWAFDRYPGLLNRHPAVIAGVLYRDCNRGRDDVTVLVARPRAAVLEIPAP